MSPYALLTLVTTTRQVRVGATTGRPGGDTRGTVLSTSYAL